ncbi:uncharacterized protein LOC141855683 isoform X2 [Brevipalpus obovatus]|uniref:uncharacterized protein LOC141855683 isoform X2 n=1 Tax=Brevipalpus obovatus TaxID=246614 RepID=UPI003D9FA3B9
MTKISLAEASFFHQFLTYLIIITYLVHRTECFKDYSKKPIDKVTESINDFLTEDDEEEDSTSESTDIFTGESSSSESESGPMTNTSTSTDTIAQSSKLPSQNLSSPISPKIPIGVRFYKFTSPSASTLSTNISNSTSYSDIHALLCEKTMVIVAFDNQKKLKYCEMFDLEKRRPEAYERVSSFRLKLTRTSLTYVRSIIEWCESMEIEEMSRRTSTDPNSMVPASALTISSFLHGIVPGTKWCGLGDIAKNYSDLGRIWQVDICCRIHDHCPLRLAGLSHGYGLMNYSFNTRSHCSCDEDFYKCLTNAETVPLATAIRNLYFSPLAPTRCFRSSEPSHCRTPASSLTPMCQAKNQKFSYSTANVISKSTINQR